jgi:hypothetical protein
MLSLIDDRTEIYLADLAVTVLLVDVVLIF